jgi:hypothetical protein
VTNPSLSARISHPSTSPLSTTDQANEQDFTATQAKVNQKDSGTTSQLLFFLDFVLATIWIIVAHL